MTQSAAAVRCLLRFIYTGGELDEAALATDLPDVLQLASQHGLTGLKKACELHLLQQLCVKRVVPALIAADQSDLPLLKAACFAMVKAHPAEVLLSAAFQQLSTSYPGLLREVRAALDVADEDEEEEEEEEEAEGEEEEKTGSSAQKRARLA